ncbi:MAG: phosphoribosyl-AMP cyclohydrolase [Balneolaceae bacterium]
MNQQNIDPEMKNESLNIEESVEIRLQFEKRGGLLPVVVQESESGDILMVASANQEALEHSIKTKEAAFWSTSRNELWIKGLTSGNRIEIDEIWVDCDQDALVYRVTLQAGGVCHTKDNTGSNRKSCFYRKVDLNRNRLKFI